ncbi:phosphoethanolamine transferase [Phaeobacter gallaeciensis]|uniref:phosphoethanolamine transferase n=1 Tax=Phaeobacter gallaeciensis TaxID=60890 RepID=UPI00237F3011|nr:sulfatase-like hydrolase/transferase [Phaeobacter gallaeciensis]MDE4063179.1 sulfatase-like hydrolase/transferase [Phaeobacter gallaeciensis]MDE4126183.1 sulfatase-like hydrolase/transferase [Phaeobacter gallaeciensis]MDE4130649.1 sulfatase-like hydrolase/transferase [Phaeobacter gallaeciensis]
MTTATPFTATDRNRNNTARELRRPGLSPAALNLIVASYMMLMFNTVFWEHLGRLFDGAPMNILLFACAVWMLTFFTLSPFALPRVQRPALAGLILLAAAAAWYQDHLGAVIDKLMIQNVMSTTVAESRQLITLPYLRHMALTGLLPAMLLLWPRITYPPTRHLLWKMPLTVVASFLLTFGFLFINLKANVSIIREHHELMGSYQPGATLGAIARYAKMEIRARNIEVAPLGRDAVKGPNLLAADKPVLLVIFVGETARAKNFGLNGYERDTTPELAKLDILNFRDTSSCGTSTAVSVPCMFSPFPRADYSHQRFMGSENLLDVLQHAGIKPVWIDNNTGDQRVALRTGSRRIDAAIGSAACASGECTDQALLDALEQEIGTIEEDTVLVLHMIGSHGPAYYMRYPQEFAPFASDCRTAEFDYCTQVEITNAYDNSIAYTDHIVASAIRRLQEQDRVLPATIYLSDHGESLGEAGLYLHAAPMFMAPEVQTKVPFLMWLPKSFRQAMQLDDACLGDLTAQSVSQDNLFHTVLGLMDVATTARQPSLDLTSTCRPERPST